MEITHLQLLEEYPEIIRLDQLYRICHISKRKAQWLLINQVIPCINSGKKTWRFIIKKADVIEYLKRQDEGKLENAPPSGIFSSHSPRKESNCIKVDKVNFANYLSHEWSENPDAFSVEGVSQLLGYHKSTIIKWIKVDKLKAVRYYQTYLIPKDWLIRYLAETVNNSISSKPAKHMGLIQKYEKTIATSDEPY